MKNMDKGLTEPNWVLISWPKIPQMPHKLSAQILCRSPKVWDFDEKRLLWVSVVCGDKYDTFAGSSYPFILTKELWLFPVMGILLKGKAFVAYRNPNPFANFL